jgi:hypothetical protein
VAGVAALLLAATFTIGGALVAAIGIGVGSAIAREQGGVDLASSWVAASPPCSGAIRYWDQAAAPAGTGNQIHTRWTRPGDLPAPASSIDRSGATARQRRGSARSGDSGGDRRRHGPSSTVADSWERSVGLPLPLGTPLPADGLDAPGDLISDPGCGGVFSSRAGSGATRKVCYLQVPASNVAQSALFRERFSDGSDADARSGSGLRRCHRAVSLCIRGRARRFHDRRTPQSVVAIVEDKRRSKRAADDRAAIASRAEAHSRFATR